MGCLKLSYYKQTELKIISSKKVLPLNKTKKNNRSKYLYGFNGQEKDNELKGKGNTMAYDARMYDDRTGRWYSLDAFSHKYPYESPYSFGMNSPLLFMDKGGNEVQVMNSGQAQNFANFLNKTFGGKVNFYVKDNMLKIVDNPDTKFDNVKMDKAYAFISAMVKDNRFKVNIQVEDNNPDFTIDSYGDQIIDIADVAKFEGLVRDNIDYTVHFFAEQKHKQVYQRIDEPLLNTKEGDYFYTNSDGQRIGKVRGYQAAHTWASKVEFGISQKIVGNFIETNTTTKVDMMDKDRNFVGSYSCEQKKGELSLTVKSDKVSLANYKDNKVTSTNVATNQTANDVITNTGDAVINKSK